MSNRKNSTFYRIRCHQKQQNMSMKIRVQTFQSSHTLSDSTLNLITPGSFFKCHCYVVDKILNKSISLLHYSPENTSHISLIWVIRIYSKSNISIINFNIIYIKLPHPQAAPFIYDCRLYLNKVMTGQCIVRT